ncbi:PLP-dependent aminotransferase family protein [Pseudoalteromonas sp. MMG005]|uniref:aminotransferase-like domain-containing protein n=1 Tax=Pseudoalteromonas sp. MMG005 TaxID=2822682 RepID=UPI001B39EDDC|nr:PLP-dependent aminotransferase family protein [Pseudoalteromonas sp. MMG005]MBQ4845057.1 PLP-dependent aminotransferase family protein [Pseudoalteromonas sp. MMG005]
MDTIWQPELSQFTSLSTHQPKYRALAELVEQAIDDQQLVFGCKLPPQRQLADRLCITHGTVTRAYALLEQRGLVNAKLGAGTFIAVREQILDTALETDFASSMQPMLGQQKVLGAAMQSLAEESAMLQEVMVYKLNGLARHQQFFKQWLKDKGIHCEQQEIIFCQGAQQAIYATLATLCQPGELVLHEAMTYPGFYNACQSLNLKTQGIGLGNDGINLDELEKLCQSSDIKAIYITPNCQNPTNLQYSEENLTQLLALSRRYNFFILEDDVNYCLPQNWRLPLWQKAPDRVFYLASLSKYFAGGLRVGYLLAPILWQKSVLQQLHAQCWAVSMMNFELLMRVMKNPDFAHNQEKLAKELTYRIDTLKMIMTKHQLSASFAGLNVYLPLPLHLNMHSLTSQLKANKVLVRAIDVFVNPHSEQTTQPVNGIRLTLGGPNSRAEFDLGITRIDEVLSQLPHTHDVVI